MWPLSRTARALGSNARDLLYRTANLPTRANAHPPTRLPAHPPPLAHNLHSPLHHSTTPPLHQYKHSELNSLASIMHWQNLMCLMTLLMRDANMYEGDSYQMIGCVLLTTNLVCPLLARVIA